MTLNELRGKWSARADEFERLGVMASAGTLCRVFLQDLDALAAGSAEKVLSMSEASHYSGYSHAHLARMVRQGKVRSLRTPGVRGCYTFLQGDLPLKPSGAHSIDAGVHDLASRLLGGKEG